MTVRRWKKSVRSGSNFECVEVAHTFDAIRDSKNPEGPMLRVDVPSLLAAVKAGKL